MVQSPRHITRAFGAGANLSKSLPISKHEQEPLTVYRLQTTKQNAVIGQLYSGLAGASSTPAKQNYTPRGYKTAARPAVRRKPVLRSALVLERFREAYTAGVDVHVHDLERGFVVKLGALPSDYDYREGCGRQRRRDTIAIQ